jgi:hypothetical protein
MRALLCFFCLLPAFGWTFDFPSKTWMYQGCKLHVTVGTKEAASIGTYLVTVVAPTGKRDTVRMDRDGVLTGAWSVDVDGDGKFEVIVATQSAGSGSYGKVGILTWTGDKLKKRTTPELNAGQMKGYMGHDMFEVRRNSLYRVIPTFAQKDNDPARPTGLRTLRLNLSKFRWEQP